MKALVLWSTALALVSIAGILVGVLLRSIRQEGAERPIWSNFGLSLAFCALFLTSWAAQGVAQWGTYRAEQTEHGEPVTVSGYLVDFGQSTLENWQSEFLQLFTMAVLTAFLVNKGSTESKDGDEEVMLQLSAIREDLAALRAGAGR